MDRRRFVRTASLAGLGIVATAGCTAPGGGEGPGVDETETDGADGSPTETETTAETETPTETGTEATEAGTETETTEAGTETPEGGDQEFATRFEFGGRVEAWQGRAPQSIAGQENPTIQLTAGERYEVTWENLDGVPHDFAIQDAQGEDITKTEIVSDQGQTLTLAFEATTEMARYICTVHPNTMVGDVEVSGG